MKKISLKEASDQFDIANRVLNDEYGIAPTRFTKGTYKSEKEEPFDQSLKKDSKINQIRSIAIQGLQEYANDVDSEKYQFYKKIWLMCDKSVSSKENSGDMNV